MSIARNSALVLGAQFIGIVGGIVTSVLTARLLGPSGRGTLIVVNFSLMLLMILANLGLTYSLVYMIGKRKLDRREALGVALGASAVLGSAGFALALAVYPLLSSSVLSGVGFATYAVGLSALPAAMFNDMWAWMRIGENRFIQATAYQSAFSLTSVLVCALVLWVLRFQVTGLLAGMTATYYAWAIALCVSSAAREGITLRIGVARLKELVTYGAKVYAGSLVNSVYLRLDTFVLNAYGGTGQVGIYSIAVALNERIWSLDGSVSQAVLPHVVGEEREQAARLSALTGRTIFGLTVGVAMVLAAASPWLIPLLYGDRFSPSVLPLVLLLPGTVLYSVAKTYANYLSGQLGRPDLSSGLAAATATVSIPTYFLLIPRFGAPGAAAASTIAYAIGFGIALFLFRRNTHLTIKEIVVPTRADWDVYASILGRASARLRG